MNKNELTLEHKIENLRDTLNKMTCVRNLTDSIVVEYSQKLDMLLNQYNKSS